MKIAAIDIGSNAIRLLIEEIRNKSGKPYVEKVSLTRVPIRLGEDVFRSGEIPPKKVKQLVMTMRAFWYLMEVHGVEHFRACATSAMRDAKNRDAVLSTIKAESAIDIEVLSGESEAELIYGNYISQQLDKKWNHLFIDVGGGSTELTYIVRGVRMKSQSFNIGTVRALEQKIQKKTWDELKNWISQHVKDDEKLIAIGTGGNINTVFKMAGKKPSEKINVREIEEQFELIQELSYEDRIHKLKLKPDRADVILPACEIYLKILQLCRIREMIVPKIGLSDGMILKMFQEHTQIN